MRVVVDIVRGAERGRRVVFDNASRVTFGRHPGNDVAFDESRDIDASTRHAELVVDASAGIGRLRDLGSSNGTWIDGQRVVARDLASGSMVVVEFGRGGPLARLWTGDDDAAMPEAPGGRGRWRRFLPW